MWLGTVFCAFYMSDNVSTLLSGMFWCVFISYNSGDLLFFPAYRYAFKQNHRIYLQTWHLIILCVITTFVLHQGMRATYSVTVENIECAFFDQVDKLQDFGSHNRETIAELVWAFFNYWAYSHDYANTVISVRRGRTIRWDIKSDIIVVIKFVVNLLVSLLLNAFKWRIDILSLKIF